MNTFPMNIQTLRGPRPLLLAIAATLLLVNVASAQLYRPERARRTIKAGPYELVIQKNSQIDLLTPEGQPLLDNAFPSLILEGGEEVPLKIDYRNTNRFNLFYRAADMRPFNLRDGAKSTRAAAAIRNFEVGGAALNGGA